MPSCNRDWELDALREGRLSSSDAAANERHRATCAECRERYAEDERLALLGRALGPGAPDPLRMRRLRARILQNAAQPASLSRTRLLPAMVALLVSLVLVTMFVVRRSRPSSLATTPPPTVGSSAQSEPFAGTVTAMPDARWSRQRQHGIERVRLELGTLTLEVRKQTPTERFFVDLPDGEIEVRGTRFDVTVRDGETKSVRVDDGIVALRRAGNSELVLHGHENWVAPSGTPSVASAVASTTRRVTPPHESAIVNIAAEYDAAVSSYRAKSYSEAARRFAAFVVAHPHAQETEDASFLEASALAHDGRGDGAAVVAERFLARYPSSFHARDAAVLVARDARNRGDCARARSVLEPWSASRSSEIANTLGACARD